MRPTARSTPSGLRDVERHIAACDACARDVAGLRMLMARVPTPCPSRPTSTISGRRSVRASTKPRSFRSTRRRRSSPRRSSRAGAASVWIVGAIAGRARRHHRVAAANARRSRNATSPDRADDAGPASSASATRPRRTKPRRTRCSTSSSCSGPCCPPEARSSVDHDLRVIDDAIAEVKSALVRDPNNPALRRLLASSYRQKVELLKRASGAS